MRANERALHSLAKAALSGDVTTDTLGRAAEIVRRATGTAEALIVYAQDAEFLIVRNGEEPPRNDISQQGLLVVQRNLMRMGSPIAFNLKGSRVEEFCFAVGAEDSEYLAFHVPTTEGSSEMCLLRAPWPGGETANILRVVESSMPALIVLLERYLNAERTRRHKQQLEATASAAQVLTRTENMRAALTDLASSLSATTGFDYVSIDVFDAETERFVLRVLSENRWANTTLAQVWVNALNPDRPDELGEAILRTRRPVLTPDLQHDEQLSEGLRAFFKQALLTSGAVFPVTFQDELLASASFVSYKPRTFHPEEVQMLESLAGQVATALKAMRMYTQLAKSRSQIQRHARRIERQRRTLKEQAEQLRKLASTDALTSVANYGQLHATIDRSLGLTKRNGAPLSIILADVDNFKLFNDTYGHLAGDETLRRISSVLRSVCRRRDTVGRYGGDEFMIILPRTGNQAATRIAQRIYDEVSRLDCRPKGAAEMIPLRLALGISTYPEDGTTKDALIGHADGAMYELKGVLEQELPARQAEAAREQVQYPISAFGLLDGLVRAVDRRDHYTKAHSDHDAEYAVLLGQALALSRESLRALRIAGLLHDIGKIGIPDRILRKPGQLTDDEREVMEQHVLLTERIIGGVPHLEEVLAAASSHHERFDGTGYPRGLKGDDIPLLGRLLAVADAFSAMTEDRPYRKALAWSDAVRELHDCSGTQFDPALVEAFIRDVVPQLERKRAKAA